MTQPIDTAFVDIVPVDKSLQKLERDIDKAMKKIDKNFERDLKKIDKNFDDAFAEIHKHFADMAETAKKNFRELEDIVDSSIDDISAEFDETFTGVRKNLVELGDESDRTFRRIRTRLFRPLQEGFSNLGSIVSDLGRAMGQLVTGVGGAITSNPLVALILVLTPAVIALAAALSQLIGLVGLIPAGFTTLLATILPVVVAFQNFGEAVSAIADGDVEKIDEALKKLSPSAAAVAREFGSLLPMLRGFQRTIQEGFFAPLVGDLTNVVRTLLPALEKGFFEVARSMGRMTSSFAELFAAPDTVQVIREIFASTARIISGLSGPFTRFADMLLNTVHEALPFVERIAAAFGRALDAFSAFVNKAIETGEFDQFLEDAITTVKELIDLGKALAGLIGTIFSGTEDSGHDFLKTLTDIVIKMDEFFKSADGKLVIDALILSVQILAASLQTIVQIFTFLVSSTKLVLDTFEAIGRGATSLATTIWDAFTNLVVAGRELVFGWLLEVMQFIESVPDRIKGLVPLFAQAGRNLIQSFMNGFRAVGGFVGDVAGDIVGAIKGTLNRAIDKVNRGIEIIDDVLPGSLGRIPRLAEGGIIPATPGGQLFVGGEGGQDEAVIPLDRLEEILGRKPGDGAMTINFGAGSINISFNGGTPTEAEARQVGKAVGQGIIDMVTKRNMRAQVRAV